MAQHYKQPSKLNLVSFLLLLVVIAATYAAIQFSPSYYRRWKAAGVLSAATNEIFPTRHLSGMEEMQFTEEWRKRTDEKLRAAGILATPLTLNYTKNPQTITATLQYAEVIKHWFVNKTTTVAFSISESIKATAE